MLCPNCGEENSERAKFCSNCATPLAGATAAPGEVRKTVTVLFADIEAAQAELVGRGVEVSKVQHMEDGVWADGRGGPWNSFFFFTDPDGNDWAVQEKPDE